MSEDKIKIDGDEITQALEDVRERYAQQGVSQTEKSKKAVLEEIRTLLRDHPEMTSREIALETGSTPKQVSAQRYLMTEKGKAQQARSHANEKQKPEQTKAAAPKAAAPETGEQKQGCQIDEIIAAYGRAIGVTFTREKLDIKLEDYACTVTVEYRRQR